jgi:hypothetical protein
MTTIAAALWLLFIPVAVLIAVTLWATESRHTRINRWRSQGCTWATIAARLNCSLSTARRWAQG